MRSETGKKKSYANFKQLTTSSGKKIPYYFSDPISNKITYRRTINKKPVKIATGETLYTKAKELVDVELTRRLTGKTEAQIKREKKGVKNPRLSEIYAELIEMKSVGKEKSTVVNYWKSWNYGLKGFFGEMTSLDLTTDAIAAFKKWYLKENPERLFEQTDVHLRMLVRYMYSRRMLRDLPDLYELKDLNEIIQKNKRYQKAGKVYSKTERELLLNAHELVALTSVNGTSTDHKEVLAARVRCGIRMGLLAGMRKREKLTMPKQGINLQKMVMRVWSLKNHKWREVPIVADLADAIREQLRLNPEGPWLFPMPSDPTRCLSSQVYDKVWSKARELTGVKGRDHDLRYTFASITAEQNWPPISACEILDMSLEEYQKTYARTSTASKTDLMLKTFAGGIK